MLSYYKDGKGSCLEEAIAQFQHVLEHCPSDHPTRRAALSNLAMARLASYQAKGADLDLDLSISLYQDALDLHSDGHPVHFTSLLNLAVALLFRLNKRNDVTDAHRSEELLSRVLKTSSPESFEYWISSVIPQTLSPPAIPSDTIGSETGGPKISTAGVSWGLPFSFRQLDYVVEQCKQRNDPELLDEVISQHHNSIIFHIATHSEWTLQSSLALALLTRFEYEGRERDLAAAIQHWQDVLKTLSVEHQGRPMILNNIATALTVRFRKQGHRKDLDDAVQLQRDALLLRPIGHPDRTVSMDNLATTLLTLFEQEGDEDVLTEAIQLQREALLLRPSGHPQRPASLTNLATTLLTQFEQSGDESTLNEAIQLHREAVELFPVGHPRRSTALHGLATTLSTRFEGFGDIQYLEDAIQLHREVLLLRPAGHPAHSDTLHNLAVAVLRKFEEGGDKRDIDEAIQLYRDALELFPFGNLYRSTALNNLAGALWTRFPQSGDIQDIDDAIKLHRESLQLRPAGHPERPASLNGLAIALWTRFEHKGDQRDLEEATGLLRDGLEPLPKENRRRPYLLGNLAVTLLERFTRGGDRKDLDEAIQHHRDALSFTPAGHPDRWSSLSNLALVLQQSAERLLDPKSLHEAIQCFREALELCPRGNQFRPAALSQLAAALWVQGHWPLSVDSDGGTNDVDEIFGLHREALLLIPPGHIDRSMLLQHFANASIKLGNGQENLDEAIQLQREALELTPVGHTAHAGIQVELAESLWTRFTHKGDRPDLEEASRLCQTALVDCPAGDPHQAEFHFTFAKIQLSLYEAEDLDEYLESAMHHFDAATSFKHGLISFRVAASFIWVRTAEALDHTSALDAYTRTLQLLDSYISIAASPESRHLAMKNFPVNLPVNAASCALRHGDVPRAVELVEQGRALLWTQMARFRTPLDELCMQHPSAGTLLKRFRDLSDMLNQQPADPHTLTAEEDTRHYNNLLDSWAEVVEQIRAFDGFSRFLLPPLFSDLREASCEGPVIILIASNFSCDAIIVLHDKSPVHVSLPVTSERLGVLADQLRRETSSSAAAEETSSVISGARQSRTSHPEQKTSNDGEDILQDLLSLSRSQTSHVIIGILRELWDAVVNPVIGELEGILKKGSRIWWCPTSIFTAFPLHAAGQYRRGGRDLERLYVSSYTPSLSALIKARRTRESSGPAHFSAIVQAKPAGPYQELFFADREADVVQGFLPPAPVTIFTKLASDASTRDEALCTLKKNRWIHFSCHGKQDFESPFNSHLAMADGDLSLLDIIHSDLSNHEFAFLSACQTAVGDETTPDEMIHLAAGLQFTGVKSVIGTLWTISDVVAYLLVPEFYKAFCAGGDMDCTKAARALHRGVLAMAKKKVPLEERIMFIHIGI